MKINMLTVISNRQVSKRYWQMKLLAPDIVYEIEPGQFFNIKCGDEELPFLRRPFSIYRINKEEKTIEFLYLVKGIGTIRLTEVASGEKINIIGPLGIGFTLKPEWSTILLLARGVGIATLAALAQKALDNNVRCIAILSARSQNDLLATETLQEFGAQVYKVTDEDGTSDVDKVERLISTIMAETDVKASFTCGSKRLSKLLQRVSTKNQIPSQIALEEHMGCAMGVCYACVCNIKVNGDISSVRVCREGPVFDLEKVVLI